MRVLVTGGTGYLGSTVMRHLIDSGVEAVVGTRAIQESPWPMCIIDYATDASVREAVAGVDAVIHCAIANDFTRLQADRRYAYDSYVQTTSRLVRAAGSRPFIFVSSDWVMDGTGHLVPEDEPPNPVNIYGVLKALGEQVALEHDKAVVRVGGVMGRHQLQAMGPRSQDVGFGYFVTTLVGALRAGTRFDVWAGDGVNEVATPSLARHVARGMQRILEQDTRGIHHLVASEAIGRLPLALLAAEVFELDGGLIGESPVPPQERFPAPVPRDTSLASVETSRRLGLAPITVREQLTELRAELDA